MKLRWFVTCSEHGVKTEPTLQYWNEDYWADVDYVECKDWQTEEYLNDKDAY